MGRRAASASTSTRPGDGCTGPSSTSCRPTDHDRIVDTIIGFDPHVVVHISVWEPFSRATPATARQLTDDAATSILGAAAECRALESVIVRSGTEIYGRAHGAPTRPDESADIDPTCEYGHMLAGIERTADAIGRASASPSAASAWAPSSDRTCPARSAGCCACRPSPSACWPTRRSPSSRTSRWPEAFVAAAERRLAEPVNVVANGAITALQAARRGRRIPIPLVGPDWALAKVVSGLLGAPVPDHVIETLHRGRLADNSRMEELLGFTLGGDDRRGDRQAVPWPTVVRTPARRAVA